MARSRTALLLVTFAVAFALSGCTSQPAAVPSQTTTETASPIPVRIGTLATEDSLPLWVAEQKGYFTKAGLPKVQIIVFQSAQERDAALAAGAIDGYMGDMIAAADLSAGGTKNRIATIMLGATPSQGRFGVAVPPGSKTKSMKDLANVPVGTSSATIQEYVLDGLFAEAGVAPQQVEKVEVKKVPVRFQLLMAKKLKAAALPEPFLSLAAQSGARIVGDDTKAHVNLSQTVLGFSQKYLDTPGGLSSERAILKAWNEAVADINKDPNSFRPVLVANAKLPAPLASTYQVNFYPAAQLPTKQQVSGVLDWMRLKGYLKSFVGYNSLIIPPAKQ